MNKSSKIQVTKTRQTTAARKTARPGRPTKGANMVTQREASTKKAAGRTRVAKTTSKGR